MVGEAPAHNEATGRDLYASCGPPVGPPLSARGERETRAVGTGRAVGRDGGLEAPVPAEGRGHRMQSSASFDARSIQAVAPLAPCVSQQA